MMAGFRSGLILLAFLLGSALADEREAQFESEVRPILIGHCNECHGAEKQSGSLRVDSLPGLLSGGDSGPAIQPGRSATSLLIEAVRREGELKMPPDKPLRATQIDALQRWIDAGAYWPKSGTQSNHSSIEARARDHWAFKTLAQPSVPAVRNASWVRTDVDAFVLNRLEQHGLGPSPEADRRTLVRRLYFTLTGMPPSFEDVEQFVHDDDPEAYEKLVVRLLDSPEYGRHMARHWLDMARYSDTKGYVYAREERFWVHAWAYREWVVRAFNEDMPYNRFLMLQIAADQVPNRRDLDQAAMGFLTIGRRFLGVKHDIIDDRIDVLMRGTMGMTVACARCHDHKYDPIPTADYYSLYGVFDSCSERLVPLAQPIANDEDFLRELKIRQEKLAKRTVESCAESSDRVRQRVADYLKAQTELHKYPGDDFSQLFSKDDLLPSFVRQWEDYLRARSRDDEPIFGPWVLYAKLAPTSFLNTAEAIAKDISNRPLQFNPIVAHAFQQPCSSFDEVIQRYGLIFREIHQRWQSALATARQRSEMPPISLPDSASEQLRQVLYGPHSPCEIKDQAIVYAESFFDLATCTELWKLQGEVDRWINGSKVGAPHALTLVDLPTAVEPRIFRRGNPLQKTDAVPRRFLGFLSEGKQPFAKGSGRLELAQAIIDPSNPLTARVLVNRVWAWHFGQGLVTTPSDFGLRAEQPSHPELLDRLASRFVAEGWSVKKLQRRLLLSSAFRQNSGRSSIESENLQRAQEVDPQNRLLWRTNPHRLTFEEFRDSLLCASGQLRVADNAKPVNLFSKPYPRTRSIFGLVDRQFLPATLRNFDFANPDLHIPSRSETTVPQQALFTLNHPIVLEQAGKLAEAVKLENTSEKRIHALFQKVLQRSPTADEVGEAAAFVRQAEPNESLSQPANAADWKYGFGEIDEPSGRVKRFTELTYFAEEGWQGSEKYPDGKLGWVRLTATGGHPGNDLAHAAIRRWTAPRNCLIRIQGKLEHTPASGDGIRAFIVSSRAGIIHSCAAHKQARMIEIESLEVAKGESIDFVVDIGRTLNSDQFAWEITLATHVAGTKSEVAKRDAPNKPNQWNSRSDFTIHAVPMLDAWQQLAHVLVCSNEFTFVD